MPEYTPEDFGPGKSGEAIKWLRERLDVHGIKPETDAWTDVDDHRVTEFQHRQGWVGSGADGLPGPKTIERLSLDPKPATLLPSRVLDLTNWKLTLPTGAPEQPKEITQPELDKFIQNPHFVVQDEGVRFRAPVNGVTTSGSNYPRCELREMKNAGKDKASWSTNSGTHAMSIEAAVTAVPQVKPHVVLGQIHDAEDDVCMIRAQGRDLYGEFSYGKGKGSMKVKIAEVNLGQRFKINVHASAGKIVVSYNGINKATFTKTTSGCYFKSGVYTQAYAGQKVSVDGVEKTVPEDTYGEVIIYKLTVTHT